MFQTTNLCAPVVFSVDWPCQDPTNSWELRRGAAWSICLCGCHESYYNYYRKLCAQHDCRRRRQYLSESLHTAAYHSYQWSSVIPKIATKHFIGRLQWGYVLTKLKTTLMCRYIDTANLITKFLIVFLWYSPAVNVIRVKLFKSLIIFNDPKS